LIATRLSFFQFVQTPNGRVNFIPDRCHFARADLRALSNGGARCPVPLNVLNQTVKVFLQCRDLRIKAAFSVHLICRSAAERDFPQWTQRRHSRPRFDPFFEFQKKWFCRPLQIHQAINNETEI
jgi:hypothetical protein